MPLYRNFEQAELDAQYNARGTVPDIAPTLRCYAEQSAAARATLPCVLDVSYGEHPDETLDIFPAATAGAPVFFFIHGGYWRLLSKDDSSFMAPAMTAAGATVVSINYSLAPAVTLDRIVDQTRRALAWVYHHIAEHSGDPRRIHVCGSSAGGHLVGMLLAAGWHADHDVPEDVIQSASPLSGLFDLEPLVHTHINAWMNLSPADALRNSPLAHLPRLGCPLLVSYGETETTEFKRQSDEYLRAWRSQGFIGDYVAMPGTHHFDIILQLNKPASALAQAIFRLMGLTAQGNSPLENA